RDRSGVCRAPPRQGRAVVDSCRCRRRRSAPAPRQLPLAVFVPARSPPRGANARASAPANPVCCRTSHNCAALEPCCFAKAANCGWTALVRLLFALRPGGSILLLSLVQEDAIYWSIQRCPV